MAQTGHTPTGVDYTTITNNSTKPGTSLRPHYYTTFQSYCCTSKLNSSTSSQTKELLPIPLKFRETVQQLLNDINGILIEDLTRITNYTSFIPNVFLEKSDNSDVHRYLIDRAMFRTMNDARIINWSPSFNMLYPIRTSGKRKFAKLVSMLSLLFR